MTVSRSLDGVLVVRSGLHVLLLSPPSVAPLSRFARGTKSRVDVWMLRAIIRLPDIAGVREWWSATSPHGHRRALSDDQVLTGIGHAIASGELVAIVASSAPVAPLRIIQDRATTSARLERLAASSAKAPDNRYRVGQTMEQRLRIVVGRAVSRGRLGPELKHALLDLIAPVNIAGIAFGFVALAALQVTPVAGEALDGALVLLAYASAGVTGIKAVYRLIQAAWLTTRATSDADLDKAADLLVTTIVEVGVATVLAILGRAGGRRGGGGGGVTGDGKPVQSRSSASPKTGPTQRFLTSDAAGWKEPKAVTAMSAATGDGSTIIATRRGVVLTPQLLELQGSSASVGNFTGINGARIEEIISRVPDNWTYAPQKTGFGIRFFDDTGAERLRLHGPSTDAPDGSNSAAGWTARIHVPGIKGSYYDDGGNIVGSNANDGHIPIYGNPKAGTE